MVYFDDVIALKSVKQDGMFLRVCEWASGSLERSRVDYVTVVPRRCCSPRHRMPFNSL